MPEITYDQLGVALNRIAQEKSEWAGLPMLLTDFQLKLEPRFPFQFHIDTNTTIDESVDSADIEDINDWYSERLKAHVFIRRRNGKLGAWFAPASRIEPVLNTIGASRAWLMEAEFKATEKLESLVGDWKTRCYLLTGSFIETSKRSGVTYVFRRLRPTIALKSSPEGTRVLCTLCLHPIGYYQGTWAGAMVPTDEVIAHLIYMRGDEHAFWKQSNQHAPHHPSSGL